MRKWALTVVAFTALGVMVAASVHGCEKPTDGAAFWWTWWVYAAAAVAAFLAVVVALFIDHLRPEVSPPVLAMRIRQERGNPGLQAIGGSPAPSRWYHLRVSNPNRRVASVHGVRVLLAEIWDVQASGPKKIWDEEVPMTWTHHDSAERTIGAPADADLCFAYVWDKPLLSFAPKIRPFSMPVEIPGNSTRIAVFRARGNEADSARFCVEITWDGKWDEAEERMAEHLQVRVGADPAPETD